MISGEALIKQYGWRYATKKFDTTKKISSQEWEVLSESLRLAPSSYGLQPWKFILVQSPEVRKKLTPVSWGQPQVETCSHYVVLAHLKSITKDYVMNYFGQVSAERNIPIAQFQMYIDNIVRQFIESPDAAKVLPAWASRQTYIAMGFLLATAAALKIDTCPMEGIESEKYNQILDLSGTPYSTVAAVAIGHRAVDDSTQHMKKIRFPKSQLLTTI